MTNQPKKKRPEDEHLPPDPGQKPVMLQRRRVWRACESCRRKKIKCDGNEPTCSQCTTSGSQCTWLQTKDRAALSRHYVQELEARLLHMESLFKQIAPALEQIGPNLNGASAGGPSAVAPTSGVHDSHSIASLARSMMQDRHHAGSPTDSSSSSVKVEDDVSETFGQLALDEHGHMRWIGGSSTMSLIQSFRSLTTSPLHRVSPMEEDPLAPGPSVNKLYFPASVYFGKVHALPGPEEAEYPERDLADKLVEAYFARFHFLLPILDKPSFLEQYKRLMDNTHDITLARTETAFMSVVFAVFACAARLVDDPRLSTGENFDDGGMGMVYYERALILHYISHTSTQISHVQCFILMSSFLCSVNCLPLAWLLIGQAVRIGQDLGLHRSPRRLFISPIEKETRRKVWWGLYCLDRMLALALGRPLGVEDADCDVECPVPYDDEELPAYFTGSLISQPYPSLIVGFILLTSLYKIAGRVLRQVYALDVCRDQLEQDRRSELQRSVEMLDLELTKWCDELPVVFKSDPVTEKQVLMGAVLSSHYYSVLTTLHRNFLPVKREPPVAPKSVTKALSSARACIRLAPSIRNMLPPSHHLAFFIQHLFSSAVILLLYAMRATDLRAASVAMDEAKSCLQALESWEGHWPGARKCRELLVELTNTASDAVQAAARAPHAPVPTVPLGPHPQIRERRRSVTLATSTQPPSASVRTVRSGRHRRTASRDATTSRRHLASPYRVEPAQRARSSSRKRGHDDGEVLDGPQRGSYSGNFQHSHSPQANSSPHSSPGSATLPSPQIAMVEQASDYSSRNVPLPVYNYPALPLSPVQAQPDSRYDYDYALQSGSTIQPPSQAWSASNGDRDGLEMYPSSSQTDPMLYQGPNYTADTNYYGQGMGSGYTFSSTTPPTSSFATQGLPFNALDYIRNYNTGTYIGDGDQDSLWQHLDPNVFGYDPELPFSLGDVPIESQAVQH